MSTRTDRRVVSTAEAPAGLLLVVSGPSGVGKTTIVREIERRCGAIFSVSATTRPAAAGEVDGRDYHFVDEQRFEQMRAGGELLECACVFGRYWYGTPRGPIEAALGRGDLVILDIDVQGALQVRETMPGAFMIFILPPSEEELLRRLRTRGRDEEALIERRFAEARREIERARSSGAYDELIVNDDLDRATEAACALVERRRRGAGAAGA